MIDSQGTPSNGNDTIDHMQKEVPPSVLMINDEVSAILGRTGKVGVADPKYDHIMPVQSKSDGPVHTFGDKSCNLVTDNFVSTISQSTLFSSLHRN